MFNAAPPGLLADRCMAAERSQALGLLRVVQDIGFLTGAAGTGYFADAFSADTAFAGLALLIAANTAVFTRSMLARKGFAGAYAGGATPGSGARRVARPPDSRPP